MARRSRQLDDRPRVGISACLLGDPVRYNGGHKRDDFLADVLGRYVDWVKVCPEVEVGMGTPREPLRLVRDGHGRLRMLTIGTRIDYTPRMKRWAADRLRTLAAERLAGYVLKSRSPSCGLQELPVYSDGGEVDRKGRGIFAGALLARLPGLPVVEEAALDDPSVREHFIERVFAHFRLQRFFAGRWTRRSLASFLTSHEAMLFAHSPSDCARLGRLVASASRFTSAGLRDAYAAGFARAMARPATGKRHAIVLERLANRVKERIGLAANTELMASIDEYRRGLVTLERPIALLRQHATIDPYVAAQAYLSPYPEGAARETSISRHPCGREPHAPADSPS